MHLHYIYIIWMTAIKKIDRKEKKTLTKMFKAGNKA